MSFGAREYLLYQGLRHSIKGSCKTETEIANTYEIYTADLKLKQIYEIIKENIKRILESTN